MSQHKTQHNIIFSIIMASFAVVIMLAGCSDDIIYRPVDVPEGMVKVTGEVIFKPLVPAEIKTRSEAPEGAKYRGIKDLYVFFFNSDGTRNAASGSVEDFETTTPEGSTHEHITFTKTIEGGQYKVFAVANIDKTSLDKIESIDDLRNFKLTWNDEIEKDLEMFGVFASGSCGEEYTGNNKEFEEDVELTLSKSCTIHSWLRRAASKVTVDFNGENLLDGVTVYIKNATLKDVASGSYLGANSVVTVSKDIEATVSQSEENTEQEGFYCRESNYTLTYGSGDDHSQWPNVSKDAQTFAPSVCWGENAVNSFHDDDAKGLPCYENRQGKHEDKDKRQDKNSDGVIDSHPHKDGIENGTYLEVEGYYVANRTDYKSEGKIIYRFMLGQDAINDFDLIRNHHYKITMYFKGNGNDVDWHIEYAEKVLDLTYPQDVNYQGKFFVPDQDYSNIPNAGHTFDNQNTITLKSYSTDDPDTFIAPEEITYNYSILKNGKWEEEKNANWLSRNSDAESEVGNTMNYVFVANPQPDNETLKFKTTGNTEASPYKLGEDETANCYIIDAPGWYSIPLVYGNGSIYPGGNTHFVNHKGNTITNKDILESIGHNNVGVKLIWQDAQLIASPSDIKVDKESKCIKFKVTNIQEGNAVIALIDNTCSDDYEFNEEEIVKRNDKGEIVVENNKVVVEGTRKKVNTKAVWSWHIWATPLFSGQFEKDIEILNNKENSYKVMPVNLGWCSNGEIIDYYPRRKCDITFIVQGQTLTRTIEQSPHFDLPRGNHPYYQWGRKDPFVGTNTAWGNKERWIQEDDKENFVKKGTGSEDNPVRLYNEPEGVPGQVASTDRDKRKNTVDCLDVLVQNPDKWHNTKRNVNAESIKNNPANPFFSINKSYKDLWSYDNVKTVYDPCPPGYKVSDPEVFTGFTVDGINSTYPKNWYDVLESNMSKDYYKDININENVIALYTDTRKLQSITFPVSGYRDYDQKATVNDFGSFCYVWSNKDDGETNSFHLKTHRLDIKEDWQNRYLIVKEEEEDVKVENNIIAPWESFYNTDGFGVRPVRK